MIGLLTILGSACGDGARPGSAQPFAYTEASIPGAFYGISGESAGFDDSQAQVLRGLGVGLVRLQMNGWPTQRDALNRKVEAARRAGLQVLAEIYYDTPTGSASVAGLADDARQRRRRPRWAPRWPESTMLRSSPATVATAALQRSAGRLTMAAALVSTAGGAAPCKTLAAAPWAPACACTAMVQPALSWSAAASATPTWRAAAARAGSASPQADEYGAATGPYQRFTNGYITWDAASGSFRAYK